MRVVFAGTPQAAVPALLAVARSRHELIGVLTRPDAPAGRGRRLVASPVARCAEELGCPVWKPQHPRDPEFGDRLRSAAPDCVPVVAYGALVPEALLAVPAAGWVNLHFSVLPAWRGAAPVQHAVWAGDEITGATTFRLVAELDAGPYFAVMTERIRPHDTAGELLTRLAEGGADLLVRTLDGLEDGSVAAWDQPSEGISYAPKLTPEDARVDWALPAVAVDRRVRACTPAPGAWTTVADQRLKLGPVLPDPDHPPLAPGVLAVTKHSVHVGTGTVPVRLGEVGPVGKRPMSAADWARGLRETPAQLGT